MKYCIIALLHYYIITLLDKKERRKEIIKERKKVIFKESYINCHSHSENTQTVYCILSCYIIVLFDKKEWRREIDRKKKRERDREREREREREIFKESEQWWIHPRYTVSLSLTLCVGRSFHSDECALVFLIIINLIHSMVGPFISH